jgi:hypothetical protein
LALKSGDKPADLQGVLETLSTKMGWVLLVLGFMHFFNLFIFSKMRQRVLLQNALPEEIGLRLLKLPTAPRELPGTFFIRNVNSIPAWRHFLVE